MKDGNIPPPHIGYNSNDLSFAQEMAFLETEESFNQYLNKSKEQQAKERQNLEDEVRQERKHRKSSMAYEELQNDIKKQAKLLKSKQQDGILEEDEALVELEEENEEFLSKKGKPGGPKKSKERAIKEFGIQRQMGQELEDEEIKQIRNNQNISEEGEEMEVPIEEDPLQTMKQEVASEEEVLKPTEMLEEEMVADLSELDEELPEKKEIKDPKKDADQIKKKMAQRNRNQSTAEKTDNEPSETSKQIETSETELRTTIATLKQNEKLEAEQIAKAAISTEKNKELQELEELAMQLIAQAGVLENGDIVETTVKVNLKKSIFDLGEITLTTYKYRPLEVNLKFKKFNHEATQMIKKNSNQLKKVLKRKSLRVHQLEIME